MRKSISAKALSDLIGAIYDCVFAPQDWEEVLASIRSEFGFATAALGLTLLRGGPQSVYASVGMDPQMLVVAAQLGPQMIELWGGLERIQAYPLDEPIICSQVSDPAGWPDNAYFQAVGMPLEVYDGVAIGVARDPDLVGHLGFGVPRAVGLIDDGYVAGLRLISPHIRRAATISGLFDLKAVEASAFAAAIDALATGVVLVDRDATIIHANTAAAAMLAAGEPIRSQRGRIGLAAPAAQSALDAAIQQAALDEIKLGQRGIAVPMRGGDGAPRVIHVLPLRRGDIRRAVMQRAVAALFVAPAAAPRLPSDALTLIYDLTPAEVRVFELICEGRTQAQIGPILGIAASTVKTHLLHIFEKTGCRRQAELVKLAAGLALPL